MRFFFPLVLATTLYSCSPVSNASLRKTFKATEEEFHDHVGFMLYDPGKDKTIFEYNSAKYFTPASNTKIFTLFASLKILGDSVPALHYVESPDSLIFWGTGDPSFLYKNVYYDSGIYVFLRDVQKQLFFSSSNFHTSHFGSGWAWDDYNSYYSVERSPLPVYGNTFSVKLSGDTIFVHPKFFGKFMTLGDRKERTTVTRELHSNDFKLHYGAPLVQPRTWDIPIRIDQQMISSLLADTLGKNVSPVNKPLPQQHTTLYSIPVDSLYRELMQDSDNFIAEQLLLMCSDVLSDSLQPEITIRYVKNNFLKDLADEPIWVDGSGLSRYNLFTPRSIVQLWRKIVQIAPRERLFPLLATGGKYGTIKNWYKSDRPYIYGKTGSLSNNHSLSGFIVTRSGKTLLFSFMSNNFTSSMNDIRSNMQDILYRIYDRY